jgi:RNA polymerase sigma factor (sigma-70 family)
LVQAVRAGDARAFEMLHERHRATLLSFCRHLTGSLEDAEDAVQHSFLAAYREISGGAARLDLKPWLFTVARNRCLSLLRARRVREGSPGLWTGRSSAAAVSRMSAETWGVDGLTDEVEQREELRALVADLGTLPELQRAALVLSELRAVSHAEVAGILGVAPDKVRSLVFQARSSLLSSREARDTPCGEIRYQLSTLRGASLRRRTLRRHLRACAGCKEFEAAVHVQRRGLAVVLPVATDAGLRGALPSVLAGGGASGSGAAGATAGVAAAGGLAGGGAAATGGGLLGGVFAAATGGGALTLTAVAAIAATGTVGLVDTDVTHRGGPPRSAERVEYAQPPVAEDPPAGTKPIGAPAEPRPGEPAGEERATERADPGRDGESDAHRSGSGEKVPPGLLKNGDDVPPGLAKRGLEAPPGHAQGGQGNSNGNGAGGGGKATAGNGHGSRGAAPPNRGEVPGSQRGAPPAKDRPTPPLKPTPEQRRPQPDKPGKPK